MDLKRDVFAFGATGAELLRKLLVSNPTGAPGHVIAGGPIVDTLGHVRALLAELEAGAEPLPPQTPETVSYCEAFR